MGLCIYLLFTRQADWYCMSYFVEFGHLIELLRFPDESMSWDLRCAYGLYVFIISRMKLACWTLEGLPTGLRSLNHSPEPGLSTIHVFRMLVRLAIDIWRGLRSAVSARTMCNRRRSGRYHRVIYGLCWGVYITTTVNTGDNSLVQPK